MPRPRTSIGRAELEILHYIADHYPITVRQVVDHVGRTTGKARTTVLTVMDRLREKGYLRRKKIRGVYQYWPRVPQAELLKTLVHDFVEQALGGSLAPFIAYLAESGDLSDKQLKALKQLVRELEARERGGKP